MVPYPKDKFQLLDMQPLKIAVTFFSTHLKIQVIYTVQQSLVHTYIEGNIRIEAYPLFGTPTRSRGNLVFYINKSLKTLFLKRSRVIHPFILLKEMSI